MEQTTEQRIGCARAFYRNSGNYSSLHPDYWPDLKAKWMKGEAFLIAKDLHGDEVVVRLADIAIISHCTPEGMARFEEDERIAEVQEKHKDITG